MTLVKPKDTQGREWERWLVDVTTKANQLNTDVFEYFRVTASTKLELSYGTVEVVTAGVTVTLPTSFRNTGKNYIIDNSSNGDVTVLPHSGDTIEGETSQVLPPDSSMAIYCNGTGWRIA